jgi:hypothetical protein
VCVSECRRHTPCVCRRRLGVLHPERPGIHSCCTAAAEGGTAGVDTGPGCTSGQWQYAVGQYTIWQYYVWQCPERRCMHSSAPCAGSCGTPCLGNMSSLAYVLHCCAVMCCVAYSDCTAASCAGNRGTFHTLFVLFLSRVVVASTSTKHAIICCVVLCCPG